MEPDGRGIFRGALDDEPVDRANMGGVCCGDGCREAGSNTSSLIHRIAQAQMFYKGQEIAVGM